MFINNKLRDEIFNSSIVHGFWDNNRSYQDFILNVIGEFEETLDELKLNKPDEVYYLDGKKLSGAPTELSDIIIFILDYFGGSNPQIDVLEDYLLEPNKYYKNNEWYELKRSCDPYKVFIEIMDEAKKHLSLSLMDYTIHGNSEFIGDDNKPHSVVNELHEVLKLVLEFCDIYHIDIPKELRRKIDYNKNRPKDYRKMGTNTPLEIDRDKLMARALNMGNGAYKLVDDIIRDNTAINDEVLRKRDLREQMEKDEHENKRV